MKGIIYRLKYQEGGTLALTHGMGAYYTNVIHIPSLKAEINHGMIREDNGDYTEKINGVKPKKIKEIKISAEDVKIIKTILNSKKETERLINKYIPDDKRKETGIDLSKVMNIKIKTKRKKGKK